MSRSLDEKQALALLQKHITKKYGLLNVAALAFGIDRGFLSLILIGKRPIPQWLADEIGLTRKRRIVYEYEVRT